jgi:hypothetical protein
MKIFSKPIFYGNSNRKGTGPTDGDVAELLSQVKEIMSINSGLQQPYRDETKKQVEASRKQVARLIDRRVMLGESIKAALDIQ